MVGKKLMKHHYLKKKRFLQSFKGTEAICVDIATEIKKRLRLKYMLNFNVM